VAFATPSSRPLPWRRRARHTRGSLIARFRTEPILSCARRQAIEATWPPPDCQPSAQNMARWPCAVPFDKGGFVLAWEVSTTRATHVPSAWLLHPPCSARQGPSFILTHPAENNMAVSECSTNRGPGHGTALSDAACAATSRPCATANRTGIPISSVRGGIHRTIRGLRLPATGSRLRVGICRRPAVRRRFRLGCGRAQHGLRLDRTDSSHRTEVLRHSGHRRAARNGVSVSRAESARRVHAARRIRRVD